MAYIGLTIVLYQANARDRHGGMMFMLNIPLLLGLAISSVWSTKIGLWFGVAAALAQVGIMGVLLFTPHVMIFPLLIINFAVIIPVLGIATWAWSHTTGHSVSRERTESG